MGWLDDALRDEEDARWLHEVYRGNGPGVPAQIVDRMMRDGLVRTDRTGLLLVLTDEGEERRRKLRETTRPSNAE
jgi:hypothetical protein